jgi:hypothetical protein
MRKNTALFGVAIIFALFASSLVLPAPRHAAGDADRTVQLGPSAHQAGGSISIPRLLRRHLAWTLQLTRALRLLEPLSAPTSLPGPATIIDEPDPTGRSEDPDPVTVPIPHPVERDSESDHPEGANGSGDPANGSGDPLTNLG